jgi:hypothetical protein
VVGALATTRTEEANPATEGINTDCVRLPVIHPLLGLNVLDLVPSWQDGEGIKLAEICEGHIFCIVQIDNSGDAVAKNAHHRHALIVMVSWTVEPSSSAHPIVHSLTLT